jgi:NAD(P)-dependent dehydrogenase (short-subunit alcohol dehydrogenase family)
MELNNKCAFVTGGTSAIGYGICEAFLHQGAKVYTCGRSKNALNKSREKLPNLVAIEADVSSVSSIERAYESMLSEVRSPDTVDLIMYRFN